MGTPTGDPWAISVRQASEEIREGIVRTPASISQTLSDLFGCSVALKFENLQFTGSFKDRGSLCRLLQVDAAISNGAIAMSAGNHAQGVAYHGARLGVSTTIVMPEPSPFVKVARTRELGATVILAGATVDESAQVAQRIATEEGLEFIHPFDDEFVIAGQGTVGLEFVQDLPDLEVIVVPVGGGGLAAGIVLAITELGLNIKVVGVQSERFPSMVDRLSGRGPSVIPGPTIADGIAVKGPGEMTSKILADYDVEMLTVSEASIEQAVSLLLEVEKTVVEGAGAVGLAAVIEHADRFAGTRLGTVLSGGNIDPRTLAVVSLRGLGRQGRLVRLRAEMDDQPGRLAECTTIIGEAGANIVEVDHERMGSVGARSTVVEFLVDTLDEHHAGRVQDMLRDAGYVVSRIGW